MGTDDGNGSGEDDSESDDDEDGVNLLARWRELDTGITTFDEVAAAVTDPTRRFLLYRLRDLEVATVEELARELAARDADADPEAVSEDALEAAKIELSHTHLPKLSASNIVEYDRRSATVRYADPPFLLETVISLFEQFDDVPDG